MFQHCALSSYALTCLGGPQGFFFLCAVFGTKSCSSCPNMLFDNIPNPTNPFRRGPVAHLVMHFWTHYVLCECYTYLLSYIIILLLTYTYALMHFWNTRQTFVDTSRIVSYHIILYNYYDFMIYIYIYTYIYTSLYTYLYTYIHVYQCDIFARRTLVWNVAAPPSRLRPRRSPRIYYIWYYCYYDILLLLYYMIYYCYYH